MSVIKNIISKAKSDDYNNQDTQLPDNQDAQLTNNQDAQLPNNQDIQLPRKQAKKKKVKKKTLNLEVPSEIGNFWMGKIKGEGNQYKKVVAEFLIKKYGLPDGFTKEDLWFSLNNIAKLCLNSCSFKLLAIALKLKPNVSVFCSGRKNQDRNLQ